MDYRSQIKAFAKQRLKSQYGTTLGAYFLALLPQLAFVLIPCIFIFLFGVAISSEHIAIGVVLFFVMIFSSTFAVVGYYLLMPFTAIGIPAFMLSAVRGVREKATYPYTSCKNYGKKLGGFLWMMLFIFLWMIPFQIAYYTLINAIGFGSYVGIAFSAVCALSLMIPGIIKAYSYSFHPYILNDCPNLTVRQSLKLSKKMTKGIKGELFRFDLSFIGWWLLTALTYGLAGFYTIPYYLMAHASIYESMKKTALANGKITELDLDPTLVCRNENYSEN